MLTFHAKHPTDFTVVKQCETVFQRCFNLTKLLNQVCVPTCGPFSCHNFIGQKIPRLKCNKSSDFRNDVLGTANPTMCIVNLEQMVQLSQYTFIASGKDFTLIKRNIYFSKHNGYGDSHGIVRLCTAYLQQGLLYYLLPTKLHEGNVFSHVCLVTEVSNVTITHDALHLTLR